MKKTVLVLTGLFFNKEGNQSMLETLLGFCDEFEVDFVSVADRKSDFYYSKEDVETLLKGVRIFAPKMICLSLMRILRGFSRKMLTFLSIGYGTRALKETSTIIVNSSFSLVSKIAFLAREHYLYCFSKRLIKCKHKKYDIVIAYEINAIRPALRVKERLLPSTTVVGKFQGTVLGSLPESEQNRANRLFWADTKALSFAYKLDGCIMTNDGTRGKQVLQKYGVQVNRILFVPNGVSSLCEEKQKEVRESKRLFSYPIQLFTLSRLVYWKRVDLGPKIISALVNKFNNKNFRLTIFGAGSTEDVRRIREIIKEYNVSDYVDYRGPIPYEETPEIFAGYDILLSLYIMNNITNPLLEAVFYGIPVMTIYKVDLAKLIGERVRGCILLKDSENEKELIQQAAEQLNNTDIGRLQEMYSYMENGSTNIGTWDQRMSKELEFIRNLKRCHE
ncbi:MAG TPA: glycosyltransferase [Mesotoga sp.]|nr:glycosyltransferase [Mesotoga sp.]